MQLFKTYFRATSSLQLRDSIFNHTADQLLPLSLKQAISHHLLLLFTSKRGKAHLQLLSLSHAETLLKLSSYKLGYFYSFFHVRIVKNFNKQFHLKWLIKPSSLIRCRCSSHSCCRLAEQLRGNYFSSLCFVISLMNREPIIPFSDLL